MRNIHFIKVNIQFNLIRIIKKNLDKNFFFIILNFWAIHKNDLSLSLFLFLSLFYCKYNSFKLNLH